MDSLRHRAYFAFGGGCFFCAACSTGDPASSHGDASLDQNVAEDVAPPVDEPDVAMVDAGPLPVIWAHSVSTLYRFDPTPFTLARVGDFSCAADLMFNIAVNKNQQIYGVTAQGLVMIDGATAQCFPIASGVYPHSLTFAPEGMIDATREVLVGYHFSQYVRIDETTGVQTPIGAISPNSLGVDVSVSGDVIAAAGHLYVTAINGPVGDMFVEVDPNTGAAIKVVASTHVLDLLGLGEWAGVAYGFSAEGRAYSINLKSGLTRQVYPTLDSGVDASLISFTGAGVTTIAP